MEESCGKFIDIMRQLGTEKEKKDFLKWIKKNWNLGDSIDDGEDSAKELLNSIAEDLRGMVPFSAILPSENINLPLCGPNADCGSKTTIHIDEFLYDDDKMNELVDNGELPRYYCGKCFSRDIRLLTLISHSMSISRIHYLFKYLLHPLKNEVILDIGSRLGPVLYGAYVYTSCPKIIGIEKNSDFCKLQSAIVKKYKLKDRIQIICNNVFNEIELVSSADVIILNNVFEFFTDSETVISSWHILAQNIKQGCILVTIPHLEDTFKHFKINFNWKDWVEELEPYQEDYLNDNEDVESHKSNIKHYKVKTRLQNFKS